MSEVTESLKVEKSLKNSKLLKSVWPSEGPVLVSLDLQDCDDESTSDLMAALKQLKPVFQGEFLPTSIVSPETLNFASGHLTYSDHQLSRKSELLVPDALKSILESEHLELNLVLQPKLTFKVMAETLVREAEQKHAAVIGLRTHGRLGKDRMLLGSFAEAVISRSKIPVLTFNSIARKSTQLSTVLFPTDFSRLSKRAFKKLLVFAKLVKCKITIAHVFEPPQTSFADIGSALDASAADLRKIWREAEIALRIKAEVWQVEANRQGIETEFYLGHMHGSKGAALNQIAIDRKADMVYLSATGGPFARYALTTTAREILTHSPVPVLVQREP